MKFRTLIFAAAPLAAAGLLLADPAASAATGLSSSDVAGLANMSQELTGPHAPYMLIVYAFVEKIRSGELKPGDRVPSVTELVETYNVSHTTARRALAKLKEMGLTDTVPGYATFVRFADQDA
jgi:DNA-binding FadR family transcriptional regulator